MDRQKNSLLVPLEAMYILIGSMIGVGIFSLSNTLVKEVYEDAWVSVALGGIYPLYLGLLGMYIIKKHPSENILILSKKYTGKVIGTILNIFFLSFFISNAAFVISDFSIIYQVYATTFLSSFRIISIITLLAAITSYRGLKLIGKINSVAFYITFILVLLTFSVLRKGSYLNLIPILDSGIKDILKGAKESAFAYSGLEILFIIYPYIKDNLKFNKYILKGIGITTFIYIITIVMVLYYLGADIVKKSYWPLITISESLYFPAVNNFRIIFAFFWMYIALKTSVNYYFAATFICSDMFKKAKRINIVSILYIILVPITLMIGETTVRNKVMKLIIGKVTLFNTIYITLIAFLILLKKGVRNETKEK